MRERNLKGQFVKPSDGQRKCSVEGCLEKHNAKGFCPKHYGKWVNHGDPLGGYDEKHKKGGGNISPCGYFRLTVRGKNVFEHRIIIEKALGHKITIGAVPHHIDGNKLNNKNTNLVLCDSDSYHQLLHMRQRALSACGHANWRFCRHCKKYDDPQNLVIYSKATAAWHKECARSNYHQYKMGIRPQLRIFEFQRCR